MNVYTSLQNGKRRGTGEALEKAIGESSVRNKMVFLAGICIKVRCEG